MVQEGLILHETSRSLFYKSVGENAKAINQR